MFSDIQLSMTHFSLDDFSDQSSSSQSNVSDEEVMLASNNPKKRAGRKKFCETRHPIYRGVRRRSSGKWVCELREPNKKSRIWLGTYPTVEMAARAHDVAAIALRGRSVCLNFADSAWRLPIPASKDTKDIQKVAAEAAMIFHPSMQVDQGASSENVNVEKGEDFLSQKENVLFLDEDDIFSMPRLISSMAEGLMLPPPLPYIDEDDHEQHLELWDFSI